MDLNLSLKKERGSLTERGLLGCVLLVTSGDRMEQLNATAHSCITPPRASQQKKNNPIVIIVWR